MSAAPNWVNYGGFSIAGTCLPCCTPPPADCSCALLIPPVNGATPYADYASAVAGIATDVDGCYFYRQASAQNYDTASFVWTNPTVDISASKSNVVDGGFGVFAYVSVSLKSGSTLSLAYSETATGTDPDIEAGAAIIVYSCSTGAVLFSDSDVGGTSVSGIFTYSVPSDDTYIVLMSASTDFGGGGTSGGSATLSLYSDDAMVANPVIALWDDSGTTRSLWACPKLLLPALTEFNGDWYEDCAAAATVLTDAKQVSNCVGYADPTSTSGMVFSFTATDAGTILTLAVVMVSASNETPAMWGGINAVAGQTLTFTITDNAAVTAISISIYDDTGAIVETLAGPSPATSSALPYTGRYTVAVQVSDVIAFPGTKTLTTASAVITSSGTLSVNPIQARWDAGLTCPATLNCGDSC